MATRLILVQESSGSTPDGTTMNSIIKYRVGRKTKRAVLTDDGHEVALCSGKDAEKNAEMICLALNIHCSSNKVGLLKTFIPYLRLWICRGKSKAK